MPRVRHCRWRACGGTRAALEPRRSPRGRPLDVWRRHRRKREAAAFRPERGARPHRAVPHRRLPAPKASKSQPCQSSHGEALPREHAHARRQAESVRHRDRGGDQQVMGEPERTTGEHDDAHGSCARLHPADGNHDHSGSREHGQEALPRDDACCDHCSRQGVADPAQARLRPEDQRRHDLRRSQRIHRRRRGDAEKRVVQDEH